MTVHTTVLAAKQTVTDLAFPPIPIPGLSDRMNTWGGWVTFIAYFACAIAIVGGGGYIAFDHFMDGHNKKGVKLCVGAIVGAAIIASGTAIISAAQG